MIIRVIHNLLHLKRIQFLYSNVPFGIAKCKSGREPIEVLALLVPRFQPYELH